VDLRLAPRRALGGLDARALNEAGVRCPSAADPQRNPRRAGTARARRRRPGGASTSEHDERAMLVLGAVVEAGSDPDKHPGADRDGRQDAGPASLPRRPAPYGYRLADAGTRPTRRAARMAAAVPNVRRCKSAEPLTTAANVSNFTIKTKSCTKS